MQHFDNGPGELRIMRRFAFYSILILFLLGALGVVQLQEPYVGILWTAFAVELGGMGWWPIRQLFKKDLTRRAVAISTPPSSRLHHNLRSGSLTEAATAI